MTAGPIHKVPCPWCNQPNNFRPLAGDDDGASGHGWGTDGFERGAKLSCDHCGRFFKIAAIEKITVVKLVPTS